jgi:LAS superfamily LD-carboxypeptidase LdcB
VRRSSVLLAGLVAFVALEAFGTTTADARTATGYRNGEKTELKIVECGGADVEVHTAKAFRLMAKAARKAGIELGIRSGYRSFKKQAALYKQYRKGNGNLAAPPGYSNHESGRALDLFVTDHRVYEWLKGHAATYGFHRTVPGEAWHWEYLGGYSGETNARRSHRS